ERPYRAFPICRQLPRALPLYLISMPARRMIVGVAGTPGATDRLPLALRGPWVLALGHGRP
ncbi:MAG: hypothetical protein AAB303_06305, partial [Chloroflexota bacterium]